MISSERAIGQLSAVYSRGSAIEPSITPCRFVHRTIRSKIEVHSPNRLEASPLKAVQYDRFGGPDVLRYLPDPRPGPGELLIKTAAMCTTRPKPASAVCNYLKSAGSQSQARSSRPTGAPAAISSAGALSRL